MIMITEPVELPEFPVAFLFVVPSWMVSVEGSRRA